MSTPPICGLLARFTRVVRWLLLSLLGWGGVSAGWGGEGTGLIRIHCVPLAGQVSIPGVAGAEGGEPGAEWEFGEVGAGRYTATITMRTKRVVHEFEVKAGQTTEFTVNLFQGKITDANGAAPPRPAVVSPAKPAKAASPKPTASLLSGPRFTVPDLGMTMIAVLPGAFTIGHDLGRKNERPAATASVTRRFWLGRTEVTQAQWQVLMEHLNSVGRGPDRPVECVSWLEAMTFCRRLTERERAAGRLPENHLYMLPLEVQWEYACRAGGTAAAGEELDAVGWYAKNSGGATHPVAQQQPNAWGFYDLQGNVAEWCYDWFAPYSGEPRDDLVGVGGGSERVWRGGAFGFPAADCRPSSRGSEQPGNSHPNLGFRVALVELPPKR